jgi:hypothetical protein
VSDISNAGPCKPIRQRSRFTLAAPRSSELALGDALAEAGVYKLASASLIMNAKRIRRILG